jgi:hypothetical protein
MAAFLDDLTIEKLITKNSVDYVPTSTATTLNGTLTLTVTSTCLQYLTGTATGYTVALPNATTLQTGWLYIIANTTSQTIDIDNGAGTFLFTLSQNSIGYLYLQTNGTTAGVWLYYQVLASSTASGIINYTLDDATPFTSSVRNPSYDLITGFSLTPQAGTYALWYNASVYYTTTPKSHWWAFYLAGVQQAGSIRMQDTAHSNQNMVDITMDVLQFNGSQTIDVRVSCDNTGSITVNSRTLILIRLGP